MGRERCLCCCEEPETPGCFVGAAATELPRLNPETVGGIHSDLRLSRAVPTERQARLRRIRLFFGAMDAFLFLCAGEGGGIDPGAVVLYAPPPAGWVGGWVGGGGGACCVAAAQSR